MMKISTSAHKIGRKQRIPGPKLASAACALGLGTAVWLSGAHAQSGEVAITCTNPSSGATWQIHINYDHRTVDSNPAVITDAVIEWKESNGWKYTLDRKIGKLTVVLASSTGGNFIHDECKLDK